MTYNIESITKRTKSEQKPMLGEGVLPLTLGVQRTKSEVDWNIAISTWVNVCGILNLSTQTKVTISSKSKSSLYYISYVCRRTQTY